MSKVFTLTLLLTVLITCTLSGCGNSDGFSQIYTDNYVDNIAGDYNQSDSNQTVNPPYSTPANNSAANKDYEEAIRIYFDVCNGSWNKTEYLAPCEFWDQEGDLDEAKRKLQQNRQSLLEECGYDLVYTYRILSATKMSDSDLSPLKSSWVRTYNGNPNDIEEGYLVQVIAIMSSSEVNHTEQDTCAVIKIRDKWYISNTDRIFFTPDCLL